MSQLWFDKIDALEALETRDPEVHKFYCDHLRLTLKLLNDHVLYTYKWHPKNGGQTAHARDQIALKIMEFADELRARDRDPFKSL